MAHRHSRESYFIVNEGRIIESAGGRSHSRRPTSAEHQQSFRFSRLSRAKGVQLSPELQATLARAMTTGTTTADPDSVPGIPAGFTYLGQFVDHDLTLDRSQVALGEPVDVEDMLQGRSPSLDLDSLYGLGPRHASSRRFYTAGGRLRTGTTLGVGFPAGLPPANTDQQGFDLPRAGEAAGGTRADMRAALIPDARNDENLAVAQLHNAFIRFHNRVLDDLADRGVPERLLFERARETVVKHYQWMLRTDFLPRIVDPDIVERVFLGGRRCFELAPGSDGPFEVLRPGDRGAMPVEFSVAAYRLGHSMVRARYQWNRVFNASGPGQAATLGALFRFSGTAGNLSPRPGPEDLSDLDDPNLGDLLRLPSNWIADFRRLFDFSEADRKDLVVPAADFNVAKRIDTLLVDPLATLPTGTFGGRGQGEPPVDHRNLAFRNLARAAMVELATGPQLAKEMGIPPLTREKILEGAGGAGLTGLDPAEQDEIVEHTPLWFHILREAETNRLHSGRLTGVGGQLVAEVFHRAMEASVHSIVKDRHWRPTLPARRKGVFTMTDLLLHAFEGDAELLNPLGDGPVGA
ncbi:heme peroxidase family protein [Streptomyces sp. NPDC051940]|uniref:peroxidase family protein n=1 Tax=Streptomyces sp. NPDC051940 TaxID=3155675 RepID=UPI0034458444